MRSAKHLHKDGVEVLVTLVCSPCCLFDSVLLVCFPVTSSLIPDFPLKHSPQSTTFPLSWLFFVAVGWRALLPSHVADYLEVLKELRNENVMAASVLMDYWNTYAHVESKTKQIGRMQLVFSVERAIFH